ncbi:hypothetical protein RhiJN_23186 [Ceratobasidium sp. AG-Ba]|nr:hypothetical protein RhiJN_23186 [Ceratobasidium sp. AG-Ba]
MFLDLTVRLQDIVRTILADEAPAREDSDEDTAENGRRRWLDSNGHTMVGPLAMIRSVSVHFLFRANILVLDWGSIWMGFMHFEGNTL